MLQNWFGFHADISTLKIINFMLSPIFIRITEFIIRAANDCMYNE